MATLHPFRALRPLPSHAARVASVPYDVISTEEARQLAKGNDVSFLHVIRPEIDLPAGVDEHDDSVYRTGAENLRRFRAADYTVEEESPSLYVYRLVMNGRPQTGIFGCVSVADYDNDVILKHELTRPVKEDDRTRHILEQRAHAEPVMLTYRDYEAVQEVVDDTVGGTPLYEFTATDGVGHSVWKVKDPSSLAAAFENIPRLYVADGHHRCKAASRAAAEINPDSGPRPTEVDYFPAVLFPMGNMNIMAYNRIVRRLPEEGTEFLRRLEAALGAVKSTSPVPETKGSIRAYIAGVWYAIELPASKRTGAAAELDVARLGEHLLEPLLGIADPRRDPNIDFVGGIRGTDALETIVDSGDAQMAISMFPTSIEELVEVSDSGELMPPKSTWFEPKLRSGLLVHVFD
ncbi:MAG: DUF1015 family protein [Rhodothermia bacterium]|nr:DUF1015 family protein [Rhodothermia bacterium]